MSRLVCRIGWIYRVCRINWVIWVIMMVMTIRCPPPVVIPVIIIGVVVIRRVVIIRITVAESERSSVRIAQSYIYACVPVVVLFVIIVIVVVGVFVVTIVVIDFCASVNDTVGVGNGFCLFIGWFSLWSLSCGIAVISLVVVLGIAADDGCVECPIF